MPPGCILAELVTHVTKFSMPLEPSLDTIPLRSKLDQLHTLRVCLTETTDDIFMMCLQIKLAYFFVCFVPATIHDLTGVTYPIPPNGFHITGDQTSYPQMREPVL